MRDRNNSISGKARNKEHSLSENYETHLKKGMRDRNNSINGKTKNKELSLSENYETHLKKGECPLFRCCKNEHMCMHVQKCRRISSCSAEKENDGKTAMLMKRKTFDSPLDISEQNGLKKEITKLGNINDNMNIENKDQKQTLITNTAPITNTVVKDFAENYSNGKLNLPRTSDPSSSKVENKNSNLLLKQFPSPPQSKLSNELLVAKQYFATLDETPGLAGKDEIEANDLFNLTYWTFDDFHSSSPEHSLQELNNRNSVNRKESHSFGQTNVNNMNNSKKKCCVDLNSAKPNIPEKEKSITEPIKECNPNNCDKLNNFKLWKSCCNNSLCPINDPTSSTYNFLLKVKMCCRTKGCQLAAKICDIYEPLVEVNTDFEDIGEKQYHYLSLDAGTDAIQESLSFEQSTIIEKFIDLENSDLEIVTTEEAAIKDTIEEDSNGPDDMYYANRRRTSTVSWSVPKEQPSASQEQLVSRATAEADKFRQVPGGNRRESVFGDVVKQQLDEPMEFLNPEIPTDPDEKSRIHLIKQDNSYHKQGCCSSLKAKFKKKKKQSPRGDLGLKWSSQDMMKRKANLGTDPVQEKKAEINSMLNKI